MTPSWTIHSWRPVLWQPSREVGVPTFEHRDTAINPYTSHESGTTGHTIWVGAFSDGEAGIAWDWSLIAPGVVAMTDPMSVITNLSLLDSSGNVLTAWQAARYLNELVYLLPWQSQACRALSETDQTLLPPHLAGGMPCTPALLQH